MILPTYHKNKLFYKYLASYFLILTIPFFIGIAAFQYASNTLRDEITSNNIDHLNSTMETLDTQLIQCQRITEQIYLSKSFNSFKFAEDPLKAQTVISELNKFKLTTPLLYDIYLYYEGDDYIYSSTTSAKLENLPGFLRSLTNPSPDSDFHKFYEYLRENAPFLGNITSDQLISSGNTSVPVILLGYPLSSIGAHMDKIVFFTISEGTMHSLLQESAEHQEKNTIILDKDNRIVTSLSKEDYTSSEAFLQLLDFPESTASKTVKLDKKSYLFAHTKSKVTGWEYVSLSPTRASFAKLNRAKTVFFVSLLVMLILGTILIHIMMRINYQPIKHLTQLSRRIFSDPSLSENELEDIKSAIEHLHAQNKQMLFHLHSNEYAIKEYILFQLINGRFSSVQEINQKGEAIGLTYTKPLFMVVTIFIKGYYTTYQDDTTENIIRLLEHKIPKKIEGYTRDNTEFNCFTLILAFDHPETPLVNKYLEDIHASLKQVLTETTPISIGVGKIYDSIINVSKSYMESISALDYRFSKGLDTIIHIDEFDLHKNSIDNSLSNIASRLEKYIEQNDTERIENTITNVINYIKDSTVPLFSARIICHDILKVISKSISKSEAEVSSVLPEYPDVFLLAEFETVEPLISLITTACNDICAYITDSQKNSNDNTLIDQVIAYIKANYSDCNFSVQQMADHFNMAQSNLSNYFKEHTGENLLNYITDLKIEKAKNMLITSTLTLKDISIEIGYLNVQSFIRRFKQLVGETPGEFRKRHKE